MARKRGEDEPSSYEPRREVPVEIERKHALVLEVIAGRKTISAAAEELGIARVNMQTLVHRAQAALAESLMPQPTGPKPTPPKERALAAELSTAQKRILKLEAQLLAMEDMLGTAGGIIRHLRGLPPQSATGSSPRSRRSRKTKTDDEDPEPASSELTATVLTSTANRVAAMPEPSQRAARAMGVRIHTLRRWLYRFARGVPVLGRRGGRRAVVTVEQQRELREQVRALHGLVGAASLAHSVAGVSRRTAARIKRDELAAMERERQAACRRVRVTVPGVVRGFDAMFAQGHAVLIAADASVPFRTSVERVDAYDAAHVARVLAADFERHGAPLVLRDDRARCHDAPPVVSVLRAHGVLCLHGPPRHPQYYGQLERQNREHQAWLAGTNAVTPDTLDRLRASLNGRWRRPTLDWRTAAELWRSRPLLIEDRQALSEDVYDRAVRLRTRDISPDLAMRLAIEQALIERGYLHLSPGNGCYVNNHPQ